MTLWCRNLFLYIITLDDPFDVCVCFLRKGCVWLWLDAPNNDSISQCLSFKPSNLLVLGVNWAYVRSYQNKINGKRKQEKKKRKRKRCVLVCVNANVTTSHTVFFFLLS